MTKRLSILALSAASMMTLPLYAQEVKSQDAAIVLAQADNTRIAEMSQRLAKLREALAAASSDEEKLQIAERIAKLEKRIADAQAEAGAQQPEAGGAEAPAAEAQAPAEAPQTAAEETAPENAQLKRKKKQAPEEAAQDAPAVPAQDGQASTAEPQSQPQEVVAPEAQPKPTDENAQAVAPTSVEAEPAMSEEDNKRAEQRRKRREERRAEREKEAAQSDDAQAAAQTIETIKPTANVEIVVEDGQKVQRQEFRAGDGRLVEKRIRTNKNGDKVIVTRVTRADGTVVERKRIIEKSDPRDGRRWRRYERRDRRSESGVDVVINIPFGVDIAPERYVVDGRGAPIELIYDVLRAEPVRKLERRYSVEEVTQSDEVRALVPRIDLDTVNFEFGRADLPDNQIRNLDKIATAMEDVLNDNPKEIFLLEGHTDAVGSELYNLQLSELRAQSVKFALVDGYGLPEDAFVTEGYGEEYLKVPTEQPERLNRRVTVRRITALVQN